MVRLEAGMLTSKSRDAFHHRWPNCKCQAAGSTHFLIRSWHLYLMFSRVSVLGPNVQQLTCLKFSPGGNGGKTNDPRMLCRSILGVSLVHQAAPISKVIFGRFTSQTPPVIPLRAQGWCFSQVLQNFFWQKLILDDFGHFSSKGLGS